MASVSYKIGGKYDGKAIKSAKKDFESLAKVVKGFAVVKVAQELTKLGNATKGIFVEQNKALTTFNTAVAKSTLNLQKLNNLKKELSHGNFIDDDSINNAMALGIQMGLTEEQLTKVMKASTDLASAGVMPLDQAVKTLSQSYSGQIGQLGKLDPELKNLTKSQLENGDAVDILAAKYNGFSDALSNTFSGRDTQWSNSVSDLKAAIGSIPESLQFMTEGKLLQPLNDITNWITENRNAIINFFLHLPEVFTTVGTEFVNMGKKTFENFPEWISSVGTYFVDMFKDAFSMIINIGKETFKGLMSLLDFAIGNPFRSSKDFINKMLNNIIEGINDLPQHFPNWAKKVFGIDENTEPIKFRFSTNNGGANATWDETAKEIEKSMSNVIKSFKDGTKKTKDDWKKILESSTDFYSDNIDDLKIKLSAILGQDLPEELQQALDGMTFTPTTSGETTQVSTTSSSIGSGLAQVGNTALSGLGQIGEIVSAALQGGIWGVIAELLGTILEKVEEVSPLFEWFENIFSELLNVLVDPDSGLIKSLENMIQPFLDGFNAVKDILGSFLNVIASIIDAVTPVLNGLTAILNKIAPVISAILQVISLIFEFIGIIGDMLNPILDVILDVIAPILEVIQAIIGAIYSFFATIINVVIDIYNAISWGDDIDHVSTEMKKATTPTAGYDKFTPDLSNYTTASASASTTSGSASYTAAKDIYVNINFDHSFVNGDAREIALVIRDEMRSAEKLGY